MSRLDELLATYNDYVCRDHHKDKDCHFSIEKRWSYGKANGYTPMHYGYVHHFHGPTFPTYEEAEHWMIKKLEVLTDPREWEWQED